MDQRCASRSRRTGAGVPLPQRTAGRRTVRAANRRAEGYAARDRAGRASRRVAGWHRRGRAPAWYWGRRGCGAASEGFHEVGGRRGAQCGEFARCGDGRGSSAAIGIGIAERPEEWCGRGRQEVQALHPEVVCLSFEGGDQHPPEAMSTSIGDDDDRAEQAVGPFSLEPTETDEAIGLNPDDQAAGIGDIGTRQVRGIEQLCQASQTGRVEPRHSRTRCRCRPCRPGTPAGGYLACR